VGPITYNSEGLATIEKPVSKKMSESWKQWQGRTIDGKFPLQSYLGGSDHSAVFLTVVQGDAGGLPGGVSQKAAIKLIADDGGDAEASLRWQKIRDLSHPNLIRLIDQGRCTIDGNRMAYMVMEYAEENLSQVLAERALTAEEAKGTLPPVLTVLQFLHHGGFVHGRIKPTNILAIDNQVKLSSDTLRLTGESVAGMEAGPYTAPEAATGKLSAATDIWQLGMTLIEVMTRHLPSWDRNSRNAPVVPESVPEPFREIARNCLQVDAGKRWTAREISERLKTDRPSTGQRQTERSAQAQNISAVAGTGPRSAMAQNAGQGSRKEFAKWPVWVAIAAVVVIAFVLIARPKRANAPAETSSTEVKPSARNQSSRSAGAAGGGVAANPNADSANRELGSDDAQLGIVQRVMPQVSSSARRSIQGKIKTRVRVNVDAAGNVANATMESGGPSKYFSRISMEAAREWKFVPADAAEQSGRREWKIQFAFTRAKTEASAVRVRR
jgi:eukaryotic-like serine/threonine-protein kinase